MGSEADCTLRFGRKVTKGKAHLETETLLFRGDFRISIPFSDLTALEVKKDGLHVTFSEGTAVFELGPLAEKWAAKIRNPKSLLDKLGVKAKDYIALVGPRDEAFLKQLRERGCKIARGAPRGELDFIFLAADAQEKLERLDHLQRYLKPAGATWVIWRKGKPELTEDHVRLAATNAGLVDVKVVKFSETHSALKLVIPLSRR